MYTLKGLLCKWTFVKIGYTYTTTQEGLVEKSYRISMMDLKNDF